MRKNIVHLTSVHSPFDTRIFHRQCKTLAMAGYQVSLVVPYEKNEEIDGVRIYGVKKYSNRFQRISSFGKEIYKKALEIDADLYHFHDPELIPLGVALSKKGKRVIYDVHEDVPADILSKEWIPRWMRGLVAVLTGKIQRWGGRKFSGIIAATPHISKQFKDLSVPLEIIQNFPRINELNVTDDKIPYCNRSKLLTYIGSITRVRGIFEMIRTFDLLPHDVKLVLGGSFDEKDLENQVKNEPGWNRVEYRGRLNRVEVAKIFSESRIGLVVFTPAPNHMESQPNKMFEYMASGLPVIASDFPLWKSIIEKEKCGLTVNPTNPEEIAEAVNYLLNHPVEAENMGKRGLDAVKRTYNWEKEAEKLLLFYEQLLGKVN